ncbi:Similar to UPF0643 protein PB2B2.08; acc. no. Q9HDU7 [Pyronema omphalodes CBS 100304]|uniref:Similar to UPF0643 protein PB2B2.08 acc. no. Q9HDU7 n=1 Tax=Pyronema omphalodes (strain CBS 100304) TaxID=1076935 RepID=U4L8B2_PYROM|nr:Similar to UPF0643 protein PB2B2.08; acc. no. Q9HDU7 [Pyronema omphalodes CBS 100304]
MTPHKIETTTTVQEISPSPEPEPNSKLENPRYLQASPYTTFPHLLDLETLDLPQRLLAKALTIMAPLSPAYATTSYPLAFNWSQIIERLQYLSLATNYQFPATSFYIIVFRSQIQVTTNREDLGALDKAAHIEAVEGGGLLKYWFGTPDENGRNLATCVWRDRKDAKRGGAGEGHRRAMERVRGLYTEWKVERLRFSVTERAGEWRIEEWTD